MDEVYEREYVRGKRDRQECVGATRRAKCDEVERFGHLRLNFMILWIAK